MCIRDSPGAVPAVFASMSSLGCCKCNGGIRTCQQTSTGLCETCWLATDTLGLQHLHRALRGDVARAAGCV
eukprot:2409620-Pyramimonas_sp.AAC.1